MKNLEFYSFSTPTCLIFWRGKKQPIPPFKTAIEANDKINELCLCAPDQFDFYEIRAWGEIIKPVKNRV